MLVHHTIPTPATVSSNHMPFDRFHLFTTIWRKFKSGTFRPRFEGLGDVFDGPSVGSNYLPNDDVWSISYHFGVIQRAPKRFCLPTHPFDPNTITITTLEAIASSSGKRGRVVPKLAES